MPNRRKQKGSRGEREFAALIGGSKVPLSGAVPGLPGDVKGPDGKIWQVKRFGPSTRGFKMLYHWLEDHDALAVRQDHEQWLVVVPLETWLKEGGSG